MRIVIGYYVYVHYRLDTGAVFYVGKGCGERAWSIDGRNRLWRTIAADCGRRVEIVQAGLTESSAFSLEKKLIKKYRSDGFQLANIQDGTSVRLQDKVRRKFIPPACIYQGQTYYRWKRVDDNRTQLLTTSDAVRFLGIPPQEASALADGEILVSTNGWCLYKPRKLK